MSLPQVPEPQSSPAGVERACAYCGARFRLLLTHSREGDALFSVACPECGMGYKVQAAARPGVELVAPRTDGKRDGYQETMF